eukprot:scaffold53064_cov32-Prasinocladus_malaysianus.AAC.1
MCSITNTAWLVVRGGGPHHHGREEPPRAAEAGQQAGFADGSVVRALGEPPREVEVVGEEGRREGRWQRAAIISGCGSAGYDSGGPHGPGYQGTIVRRGGTPQAESRL